MAVSMAPSGSKPSMSERKGRMVDVGGGVRGREVSISAEVVSVDPAANTVTFKGPKGNMRTVNVQNAALQAKLTVAQAGPGRPVRLGRGGRGVHLQRRSSDTGRASSGRTIYTHGR